MKLQQTPHYLTYLLITCGKRETALQLGLQTMLNYRECEQSREQETCKGNKEKQQYESIKNEIQNA